jgi:undecaprenyl-diphosphatase
MDSVISWVAQYLLWVMVLGFAAVWLFAENRRGKLELGLQAVIGLVFALLFLYIAKSVHHDPRPFVENPHIKPLFAHGRDDGFPSDHSVAAGLIATLVLVRHRLIGLVFAAAAVAIAWARVAAHVHHLQDVLAGLLLGALAAAVAIAIVGPLLNWATRQRATSRPVDAAHH